jgi:5-methyltetrahydropteroyltriglutamate--homocysteine methyltransferase
MLPLLETTVIGSYPQPEWLIDRDRCAGQAPRARGWSAAGALGASVKDRDGAGVAVDADQLTGLDPLGPEPGADDGGQSVLA